MLFSSVAFLFYFLPALLLVYYLVPRRLGRARNGVLLAFSLFFYAFGGPRFLALIGAWIAVTYGCGLLAAPRRPDWLRRLSAAAAAVFGVGLLLIFKYAGFFAETLNALGTSLPVPEFTLPLGISFFTFQGLSYVFDVRRGAVEPVKNPLRVALYISFFPYLLAGPIVRYTTIGSQFSRRGEGLSDLAAGAVRLSFGLSKKLLLAGALGEIADAAFARNPGVLGAGTAWLGALAYTGQIYFDFSSYTDMAIGLGRMFGFYFPENFRYPYIAQSITDFWRRWHISLTSWFRDYVYIPLGGNRCPLWKNIRNIAVVWLLTGLWHGASWSFVFWGLWFCLLLLGEKFVWGKLLSKAPAPARLITTLALVVVSWVFFRSPSLSAALSYLGAMFGGSAAPARDGQAVFLLRQHWPELVAAAIAATPVKNGLCRLLESRKSGAADGLLLWGPRLLALLLLGLSYMRLVEGSFNPFIYFQF